MSGADARRRGREQRYGPMVQYRGDQVPVGTWHHWQLMQRACLAKFTQHAGAGAALRASAPRPLVHRVRKDSRTIPGVIMADIWMRIRRQLVAAGGNEQGTEADGERGCASAPAAPPR